LGVGEGSSRVTPQAQNPPVRGHAGSSWAEAQQLDIG